MPRPKGIGKGPTQQFSVRLDQETAAFYRKQANVHGMSLAEFLRHLLVQGVIAETVQEIEVRLQHAVAEMQASRPQASATVMPENVLLSLFTSEALLSAIVEARNPQQLYEAQNAAKRKLKRMTGP